MQIFIEYQNGEKKSPLEIDLNETVEFLKFQLYSLTNIPPTAQHILGLPANVTPTDGMLLRQLNLTAGQRLIVKRRLTADTPILSTPTSTPTTAPARPTPTSTPSSYRAQTSYSGAADLIQAFQTCCTRSFFGTDTVMQPSAFVGDVPICTTCSQTCHPPNNVKPRVSSAPFMCGCAAIPDHECLYSVRSLAAMDRLSGAMAEQGRAFIAQVATQLIEQQLSHGKQQMQGRINAHLQAVLEYENPEWQQKAREVIPLDKLQERAQKALTSGESTCGPRDELMNQLLHWFKHEFFQWVNAPKCDTCGIDTSGIGATRPDSTEIPFRPGVVELYKCASGHITRFPRYNHALKLLETHRGRCGEWAQAFTLCCRALGYEARSANDWTDHVWTEYYSEDSKRWIHADSCEARRDAPLLYEGGWNKKLNYIIATSKDEVVDVTQRYTKKWTEVQERRILCPESWLQSYVLSLSQIKLAMMPVERRNLLLARRQVEQAEFAANVAEEQQNRALARAEQLKEEEKQGRTTGSVEWRLARGELGADAVAIQRALNPELAASASSSSSSIPAPTSSSTTSATCIPADKTKCSTDPVPPPILPNLGLLQLNSSSPPPTTTTTITASSSSLPVASATTTTTPLTESEKIAAAAKAKFAALFKTYLTQLNKGCGTANCTSEQCKSNPLFAPPITAQEIGKLALELTKTGNKHLCQHLQHQ